MAKQTENRKVSDLLLILWAGGAALLSYSLVYALRKPYTAASFDGFTIFGTDYKVAVTTIQILGYLIAKFFGIKIISELKRENRFRFFLYSAILAEVSLIAFGLLSVPYNVIAMLVNGLSLGCMWGVIFSFIEGRKVTDMLVSLLVESQRLQYYLEEDYAAVVAYLVKKQHPDILLVGATQRGRGLSARLAALLHTGLTADCTELDIDTEKGLLQQIRPAFGGNLMATIVTPNHRPQMASVRPGVMQAAPAAKPATCEITQHDITALPLCNKVKILDEKHNNIKQVLLEESRIVVGIGKGVKSKELVARLTEWAQQHGAAIAGSRAAVEAGLIEPTVQVGQTGHTISPDVYIAIGISGQIQHTAAIMGAKKIIAINPDANAPIFRIADYGWVATAEDAIQLLS